MIKAIDIPGVTAPKQHSILALIEEAMKQSTPADNIVVPLSVPDWFPAYERLFLPYSMRAVRFIMNNPSTRDYSDNVIQEVYNKAVYLKDFYEFGIIKDMERPVVNIEWDHSTNPQAPLPGYKGVVVLQEKETSWMWSLVLFPEELADKQAFDQVSEYKNWTYPGPFEQGTVQHGSWSDWEEAGFDPYLFIIRKGPTIHIVHPRDQYPNIKGKEE